MRKGRAKRVGVLSRLDDSIHRPASGNIACTLNDNAGKRHREGRRIRSFAGLPDGVARVERQEERIGVY